MVSQELWRLHPRELFSDGTTNRVEAATPLSTMINALYVDTQICSVDTENYTVRIIQIFTIFAGHIILADMDP